MSPVFVPVFFFIIRDVETYLQAPQKRYNFIIRSCWDLQTICHHDRISWRSGPTGSGAKWVLVRALHQAAKLGPCRGGGLGCRERELIMVSSSGNVSGNECGSAGKLINLRGGCALWTIRILRAVARQTDKTSPEECAGPGGCVRVNMLEIASAVLFENFNCIVELSHECFSLPENDTWAWNAVFLSWRGLFIDCLWFDCLCLQTHGTC